MTDIELLKLKNKITEAKQSTAELKGHRDALMKQLKEEWECKSIEDAEKLMEKMDKEITALNSNIEKLMKELEEKYEK